jgi:hypothetical protein
MFHGFGTHKTTFLEGTPVSGNKFEFHHGLFKAGKKDGFGLNYSDEGVYMGGLRGRNPPNRAYRPHSSRA